MESSRRSATICSGLRPVWRAICATAAAPFAPAPTIFPGGRSESDREAEHALVDADLASEASERAAGRRFEESEGDPGRGHGGRQHEEGQLGGGLRDFVDHCELENRSRRTDLEVLDRVRSAHRPYSTFERL